MYFLFGLILSIQIVLAGFSGDTLVYTPQGYIPIKDINPSYIIYSYDNKSEEVVEDRVTEIRAIPIEEVIEIKWDRGSIFCAPNQRI